MGTDAGEDKLADTGTDTIERDSRGCFIPGHKPQGGRPAGKKTQKLLDALESWEKTNGVNMLHEYFLMSQTDPACMRDLMSKIYPNLKAIEISGQIAHRISDERRANVRVMLMERAKPCLPSVSRN